jgi:hypothetical protein
VAAAICWTDNAATTRYSVRPELTGSTAAADLATIRRDRKRVLDGGDRTDKAGNDTLMGGDGDDLRAGDGDDVLRDDSGTNYLEGGAGFGSMSFPMAASTTVRRFDTRV